MAIPSLNVFRSATENLPDNLHLRATWRSPFYNMVRRGEFVGYATQGSSTFTIERSEPYSSDENWERVSSAYAGGTPCTDTINTSAVGFTERKYLPEKYTMSGILLCRNDIPLNFNTEAFWDSYYRQLEHRGAKTEINRLVNVNMHMSSKFACVAAINAAWYDADLTLANFLPLGGPTTPCPGLGQLPDPTVVPYYPLNAEMLESGARRMFTAGATAPDSDGWLQMGPEGVIYPLIIGNEASNLIFTQNADLLNTMRFAYMGAQQNMNPLLLRFGATTVLKSFRYIFEAYPPRWGWNTDTQSFVRVSEFVMLGFDGRIYRDNTTTGIAVEDTATELAIALQFGEVGWNLANPNNRATLWSARTRPTSGMKAVENPCWSGQNFGTDGVGGMVVGQAKVVMGAPFEGAYSPNPHVMIEEIVRPISQMRNVSWTPTNYMGEWIFVPGVEAVRMASRMNPATTTDIFGDYGIHAARFWHAFQPVHPEYGSLWVFKRCAYNYTTYTCPVPGVPPPPPS